jgi:uncharacterized damage-inducible protein DinB
MIRPQNVFETWKSIRSDTALAVEEFPPEAFDEKPVQDVASFREIAQHILDAGHGLSGLLLAGETNFGTPEFRQKLSQYVVRLPSTASPGELAQTLRASLDERTRELQAQGDDFFAGEMTRFDGTRITRLEFIQWMKEHELTHRSQLFMLMRLKGLVPATTRRRRAASK